MRLFSGSRVKFIAPSIVAFFTPPSPRIGYQYCVNVRVSYGASQVKSG